MKTQAYDNMFRMTVICIDSYENMVPCGRIYNMFLESGIAFRGTIELLKNMESMLEEINIPQSFSSRRVFWQSQEPKEPVKVSSEIMVGAKGTFSLRILFRQNASWQGAVLWHEGRREESFRSVLELLFLLDSALSMESSGNDAEVK